MTQKVFILTDQEIAGYTAAHQQQLLNALEQVSLEHPTASIPELIAYARQQLVIAPAEESMDYKALTAQEETEEAEPVIEPEEPAYEEPVYQVPVEEPVAYEEPAAVYEEPGYEEAVVYEEPVSYEEPPVYVEEPAVYEEVPEPIAPVYQAPVEEPFPQYQEPAYTPPATPEEEPEEETAQSIAFRTRKFQGLFHEASKLDEG